MTGSSSSIGRTGAPATRVRTVAICVLAATALIVPGCSDQTLRDDYGRRRGVAGQSVNGTAVLSELFEAEGFEVSTWRRFSPALEEYEVIVWAPNSFTPPGEAQHQFLNRWLVRNPNRTLVYIGRDYEATAAYWRHVQANAPPEDGEEFIRREARARAEFQARRMEAPAVGYSDWFTAVRDAPLIRPRTLSGPWSRGVNGAATELELWGRLREPTATERNTYVNQPTLQDEIDARRDRTRFLSRDILLQAGGEPIVTSVTGPSWGQSRIILVANGSFLLNYALVNPEHRKLALRLVRACGSSGDVAFVESDPGGPPVLEEEQDSRTPTFLSAFTTWPIGFILMHMAVFGIIYCFAVFPIFGRAGNLPQENTGDFGHHITALGELLEKTGDRNYALQRLNHYQQFVRRESGASHLREKRRQPAPAQATTPGGDRGNA